jgi:hypothetical protein
MQLMPNATKIAILQPYIGVGQGLIPSSGVGQGGCEASCKMKTESLGPISWTFKILFVGKGRKEEEEY